MIELLLLLMLPFQPPFQTHIDLANLKIPFPQDSILKQYACAKGMELGEFEEYKSKDEGLLWFLGQSLEGCIGKVKDELENGSCNGVKFYKSKNESQVGAYQIHTETKDKTETMKQLLAGKFGKATYHYEEEGLSFRVWEKEGNFYFLETSNNAIVLDQKTEIADLTVISAAFPSFLSWFVGSGGFGFYGDYLKERAKPVHKGKKYGYSDFIREQEEEAKSWGKKSHYSQGLIR